MLSFPIMANEDGEVFFVESSDDDESGEKERGTAQQRGNTKRASTELPPSPTVAPHRFGSQSMEDILFERPLAPSLRERAEQELWRSHHSGECGTTSAGHADDSPVPLEMLSGHSVNAVPQHVYEDAPRSLSYLRGMTCSEVRERLETFFLKKDAIESRFKKTEADIAAKGREDHTKGVRADLVTVRQRDRCARLVNIRNWGDGNDSPQDVLLPAALVPTSAFYTEGGSVNPNGNGSGGECGAVRTLRKHQIDGVRFMWGVLQEGPVGQVPAVGCILAHTMGLGKTAQVVVFAHLFAAVHRRRAESDKGQRLPLSSRILIVVPKSTVSVWEREFASWGAAFPAHCRLTPVTLEDVGSAGSPTTSGYKAPAQRLRIFYNWRRQGGVLLVGYEALVRLMQLVEEDNAVFGATASGGKQEDAAGFRQRGTLKHLKTAWKRDGGELAYGGDDDPFTELLVCDEAHRLKSAHLQIVAVLRGLHPLRRLLLTGTPLQNHLSEYWAMIDFAVHKYFDRYRFKEFFVDSIESTASKTASRQAVALAKKKTFTLINEVKHFVQRVDSSPLQSELPPLREYVVVVPLSDLQKSIYVRFVKLISTLYRDGAARFPFLPSVSFAGKIASHPQLLFAMRDEKRQENGNASANRRPAPPAPPHARKGKEEAKGKGRVPFAGKRRQTRRLWKGSDSSDEASSSLSESESTSSGSEGGSGHRDSGSSDSGSSDSDVVVDEAEAEATRMSFSQLYEASVDYDSLCKAPPRYVPRLADGVKLHVAMNLIKAAIRRDEKTLLFSLSTRLLDFFERLVAEANASRNPATDPVPIQYCRLDGSHTGVQRTAVLSDFNRADSSLNLFLLSVKAGGVGVTITAATRVILVDSSFNPADDQQAIGRAYRYGQTKPVFVYRLLCYQTLEYSIFEQKLAKEWLFKTVVDEAAMKRDALSGMHLKQIFGMLQSAAKAMQRAPKISQRQMDASRALAQEDGVLSDVCDQILYAQRYEVFLTHDGAEQFGDEEQKFYEKYRRDRLFEVGANVPPHELLEQELSRRKRQRSQQSEILQREAKSLTGLVDRLIRSRVTTDPHLTHLLSVMGLHVDPQTGTVRQATQGHKARAADSSAAADDDDHELTVLSSGSLEGEREEEQRTDGAPQPQRHEPTVLLEDDDDDNDKNRRRDGKERERGREAATTTRRADLPTSEEQQQQQQGIVVNASRYAPYRPGNSPHNAIDIDGS